MTNISINADQRLYVIPCADEYSCYGFDNADDAAREAARVLNRPDLIPTAAKGTLDHYQQYKKAESTLAAVRLDLTHFHYQTPKTVRDAIEQARKAGTLIRIFCGDTDTGKAWAEEFDVTGTISRSMGPIKVPLLIDSRKSHGGFALLDHCIVAIMTAPGSYLYKHPTFSTGTWAVRFNGPVPTVYRDEEIQATFKTLKAAQRYVAFMKGERLSK